MTSLTSTFLREYEKYMSEKSAVSISQIDDTGWLAVIAAMDDYSGGATCPGIDCEVAVTRETLDDFDAARAAHWSERGTRREHTFGTVAGVKYTRFQIARGAGRRDMMVLDLGAVRVSLY